MLEVRRKHNGDFLVTLHPQAAMVLAELPQQLRLLLKDPDFTNRVVQRLFPAAYRDKQKEAEYRTLLGDDLVRRKLESIEAFEKTLKKPKVDDGGVSLIIEKQSFDLWLGFVNDMRLVLATELDITDNNWSLDFEPTPDTEHQFALLQLLSWLEEELLRAKGGL